MSRNLGDHESLRQCLSWAPAYAGVTVSGVET